MAIDDELKTKATQLGTEAGGRIFNSMSTEFAPQPFTSGGGGLPRDRGIALTPAQELAQPPETPMPGGARVGIPNRPELRPSVRAKEASMRADYEATRGPSDLTFTPGAGPAPETASGIGVTDSQPTLSGFPTGFEKYGEGIRGGFAEPETASTRAGDAAARSRIMGEAVESGRRGLEVARGQDVLDTEARKKEASGQDFDFGKYREALSSIGGNVPLRMKQAILGHMFGAHEKKAELAQRMREMEMTHGEGSPSMIGARSEAKSRAIQDQYKLEMLPHEKQKLISEDARIIAETKKIPSEQAHLEAQSNYWTKMAQSAEFGRESAFMMDLIKAHDTALPGSPEQKKYQEKIDKIIDDKMGQMQLERYLSSNPSDRGKVTWRNGRLVKKAGI